MTFPQLVKAFLCSRGGWIAAAVAVAFSVRLALWPVGTRDLLIAMAVVVVWPFAEYAAHRWAMHEFRWTPFRKTHDRHHAEPTTATGLPDGWVIAFYYINSFLFAFTTQGLFTAHCVILAGLCVYEFVHFSCHTIYQPRTWYGFAVRANHLGHHGGTGSYSMLFPCFRYRKKKRFDDTWTVSGQQIDEFARVKSELQYWENRCNKITDLYRDVCFKLEVKEALEKESQANLEKSTADNSNQHAQIILLGNQIMQLSGELEEAKQELEATASDDADAINSLECQIKHKHGQIDTYMIRNFILAEQIAYAQKELADCKATLKTYMEPLNQQ
jgi:hypothetical protein